VNVRGSIQEEYSKKDLLQIKGLGIEGSSLIELDGNLRMTLLCGSSMI